MNSGFRSAEEAKQDHIARMGLDLGTIYDALWQQVAWVHAKWSDYVVLFGTSESRVKLLNEASPAFFRHAQDSIWDSVLLHITRLTDPPATGGKQNLTVQRLPALIDHPETKAKVNDLVAVALATCDFARDWRNRHLAHLDLDLSVNESAKSLEFASREKVNDALSALEAVLNGLAAHYLDATSFFKAHDGDAESLLYVIDDGLRSAQRKRERLLEGHYDEADFKPRSL